MKTLLLSVTTAIFIHISAFAQTGDMQIEGREVAGIDDVIFNCNDKSLK